MVTGSPSLPPRLSPGTHVGRVALQIGDLARSVAFYRDGLGLAVLSETTDGAARIARLGVAGQASCLIELHERPGARRVPTRGLLGLYHIALLLPSQADLGRFIVHAANAGLRFAAADHLFSEALYLTDPDGLQVEVYRDRPRDTWQYENGELVGDTRPLDFDPIVAAGGNTAWSGMPHGTAIGHVHLYIGDLVEARRFYVDGLGFAPSITTFPGALFVAANGYHHHVGLNTWNASAPVAGPDDARLLWWEMVVPHAGDATAVVARLRSAEFDTRTDQDGTRLATDRWGISVRITAPHSPI